MDVPLLQTKLYIPAARPDPAAGLRTSLVPRPRLLDRLNEGLAGKLTLVSAPAGFGKTTLVSDWLRQSDPRLRTAWLSLDDGDMRLCHCDDRFRRGNPGLRCFSRWSGLPGYPGGFCQLAVIRNPGEHHANENTQGQHSSHGAIATQSRIL